MVTKARIAAASTLAAEARLLEATIAHMDQGLLVLDSELNLVLWNRRYEELCDLPAGFLRVGLSVVEVARFLVKRGEFGPDREGLLEERVEGLRNTQVNSEVRLHRRGVTLRINRHPLPEGGSVTTLTDITREHRALERAEAAEKAAEAAHTRLMTALDASPQGFALFDADDRLVISNRQYLNQFPFLGPNDSIVDWTFEKIVDTGLALGSRPTIPGATTTTSPAVWKAWRMAIHRNPPAEPVVYQRYDGRWFMVSEKRIADGGIVVVRIDVTDLKQAEQDLRVARDEAEAAGRAKDEFLASMSHELRTPLNAIMGFAEILKGEMFGPLGQPRYRGYADDILTSATYLLELIRDILDMSKIEAGRMDLASAPIEAAPEIDRCIGMVRGSARSAGLTLEMRVTPGLPRVRADSRALRQILLNLLSNAIKFTPSGGRIVVSAASHDDRVRIAIADTGIGIPAEALPRLGRPFEQVDNVLQRKRPGSGLGLALSRSFAELMEGTLEIESTEGQGTTVTLSLSIAARRATE